MKRTVKIISNWYTLIDDFSTSGQDFYNAVEAAVGERKVPDVKFSKVNFKEGGIASSKRTYLRIERQFVAFDICAAPYGTGFFFSWWLTRIGPKHPLLYLLGFVVLVLLGSYILLNILGTFTSILWWGVVLFIVLAGLAFLARRGIFGPEEHIVMIPVVGWIYEKIFNPITYYSLDTALMFQESIRRAINDIINDLLSDQGLQALSDSDLEPTTRSLVE